MAHERCMMDEEGYTLTRLGTHTRIRTHTQIYNTYCFSTVTLVSRTRLSVTAYIRCLSPFLFSRIKCFFVFSNRWKRERHFCLQVQFTGQHNNVRLSVKYIFLITEEESLHFIWKNSVLQQNAKIRFKKNIVGTRCATVM
jgi:hypothetical protein